jgi:hypothetical protein
MKALRRNAHLASGTTTTENHGTSPYRPVTRWSHLSPIVKSTGGSTYTIFVVMAKQERRRTARFPFVASAKIIDAESDTRIFTRISDLSLHGCHLDMPSPIPQGTTVFTKIWTGTDFFEADSTVVYQRASLGIGLTFRHVEPQRLLVLKKWLLAAKNKERR